MCIAGCKETELKEPFDTAVFDPMLYHRSGTTFPHVVKLSIHWKLRSVPVAGPSGVKSEGKVEDGSRAVAEAVAAQFDELGDRKDEEAVSKRKELLAEPIGPAFPAPASEQKPVVKAVVQPGVGLVKVEQKPVTGGEASKEEKNKVVVKKETTSPKKNSSPNRKRKGSH